MEHMVKVTQQDANNYCRVLHALGLEEEGDPVAEIDKLHADLAAAQRELAAYKAAIVYCLMPGVEGQIAKKAAELLAQEGGNHA